MKLTTGYDFQGYFITEYYDVIFTEMIVGMGLGKSVISSLDNMVSSIVGSEATAMIEKVNEAKTELRKRVIEKAERLGANALIGIDFESTKIGGLIMVSMTATAVKIEKILTPLPKIEIDVEKEEKQKENERIEALKTEKMNKFKEQNTSLSIEELFDVLKALNSTQEMYDLIQQDGSGISSILDETVLKKLNDCVAIDRMYGKGSGKNVFISTLRDYLKKQKIIE